MLNRKIFYKATNMFFHTLSDMLDALIKAGLDIVNLKSLINGMRLMIHKKILLLYSIKAMK